VAKSNDCDEDEVARICSGCIGEDYLASEVETEGHEASCSYCGKDLKCFSIEELAERVETAFSEHYYRTSDQPNSYQSMMLSDKESTYDWERDGEPVADAIMNSADIPEAAASDIQKLLEDRHYDFEAAKMSEESEFSSDSYYEERAATDKRWHEEWRDFERSLKEEARFFSRTAIDHLRSVFCDLQGLGTRDGRSLIVDAGPETSHTSLYRARAFQSDKQLEEAIMRPDRELGPPPSDLAKAGRMNAQGISVFYGANNPQVALAEVRPPVGCQVAVARFDVLRSLKLLDLTALKDASTSGSVFDPESKDRFERTAFLRTLSHLITTPVMPDNEASDYLATQAIADFLATENAPPLDGLIFPSVQSEAGSLNIVLFHKAARVEEMQLPEGSELSASLYELYEEGAEREYTVIERVPPEPAKSENEPGPFDPFDFALSSETTDSREATLHLDHESLEVHVVGAVSFATSKHRVDRLRWDKRDPEDEPF
jgi:RES domain/HEPN/RES N-terminal domain 1